uniref:beta strand repeat-containing protein n=1 Tax=Eudoraea algarum TaxID=3417568 RepID=UPI003D369337
MKSNRLLLFFMSLCISIVSYGQVSIGSPVPDGSAQLDITASDKGVLIPRVALQNTTDATTITNGNVNGLVVYVPTAAGDIVPGFYFWQDTTWERLLNPGDVTGLETVTVLEDRADGLITYIDEDGTVQTVNKSDITDNGDGTYTFTNNDGSDVLINTNGITITDLVVGNLIATVTEADGTITQINETIATFVDNADGTITYTDEGGTARNVNKSDITDNGDGTYTFTNNDGSDVTINTNGIAISNVIAGNRIATVTEADGTAVDIDETITTITGTVTGNQIATYTAEGGTTTAINETIATFVDNADGTITYTDEGGTARNVDKADITDNGDGTYTFTNNDGSDVTIDTNSIAISNLIAGNRIATVTAADGTTVDVDETIATFVDNADGTITYTDEGGTARNVNKSDITDNGDGTYTFTNNDGSDVTINTNGIAISNVIAGNRIATVTEADGTAVDIDETITTIAGTVTGNQIATYTAEGGATTAINETIATFVDNADGTITYTDEGGTARDVSKADITDNADGTYTFTNNDGSDVTINTNGIAISNVIAGNLIATVTEADGTTVDIDETIATFVDNADGTITYTDEGGTARNVDKADITDNGDGTYTFTNNDGSDVTITTNGIAISNVIAGNLIATVTEADGTAVDIDETITTVTGTVTGNQIATYTAEGGATTAINETVTSIALNADNTNLDYVDEDGTTNQVDLTNAITNLETVTSLAQNDATGDITYTDEDGGTSTVDVISTNAGNLISAGTDGGAFVNAAGLTGDGSITSNDLTVGGGTNATLTDVTLEIAAGMVGTTELANNAVTTAKIADSQVTSAKITDGTITGNDIASNTIETGNILNGTIAEVDIANDAVALAKLANGTAAGQLMRWNGTDWLLVTDTSVGTDDQTAAEVTYDNTVSGLLAADVQDAVDEVLAAALTVDITDNGDGTLTFTDATGGTALVSQDFLSTDANNDISAGTDGGIYLDVSAATITEADGIVGNEVTNATDATLTRSGTGTAASPYTLDVAAGGIDTAELADDAVTTVKITDANVTLAKLADGTADGNIIQWNNTASAWEEAALAAEADGIVGNEVTNATASGSLTRSGSGTTVAPYTLDVADGGIGTAELATDAVTT